MQHTVGGDESDGRGSTRAQLQPEAGQYGQSMGRKCATGGKWLNFPIVCWRANAGLRLQENNGRAWPEVRSSSAFLGANDGSRAGASAVDDAIFRQVAQGSVWGNLQRHDGAREHVNCSRQPWPLAAMFCRLETGNVTSVLGDGVGTGGRRDHQKPRPVKLAPATLLADAWPRFSLPCNPALRTGPVESGARFRGHEEKNRTETATNLCSPASGGPLFLLCRVWLGAS